MPAVSKSQQRLFGMVHAYNKGELSCDRRLRGRIADIAKQMSDEDVRHFAKTPHGDLPETKSAQVSLTPEQVRSFYGYIPEGTVGSVVGVRSRKRRSFLGSLFRGGAYGTLLGGIGGGVLGAVLSRKALAGSSLSGDEMTRNVLNAALRVGAYGAKWGAGAGAVGGGGLYVLDKVRGGDEE